jgi:group II intron reverse transcriptase/maturase/CRISPR-associated endonuclease Cas1
MRKHLSYPELVIDAIVRGISNIASGENGAAEYSHIFFHRTGARRKKGFAPNEAVNVEIIFTTMDRAAVEAWQHAIGKYFADAVNSKNFSLSRISEIEERTWKQCAEEQGELPAGKEICLEFLEPLSFKVEKGKPRTFLSAEQFASLFQKRFERLFPFDFALPDMRGIELLPFYWHYEEYQHRSMSEGGTIQYIKGCVGKLFLRGRIESISPFLIAGTELHAGTRLANEQGYYRIIPAPLPYFEQSLFSESKLSVVIQNVLEQHDHAAEELSVEQNAPIDRREFAQKIAGELRAGSYTPSPNKAFMVTKRSGGERMVEQLSYKDLIVQEHLLALLSDVGEKIFEESSIGFRKGVSRKNAAELIRKAFAGGFQFVIVSDIEDFFPSVDLGVLAGLIDTYLPKNDAIMKELLLRILHNGYILNGTFHQRTKGIAQGSPLSPFMANLYLDAFDEAVEKWGVHMVRYADDFILLTKTKEEAETILSETESYLSHTGLKLKKDKTSIVPIEKGFQFLGMQFDGAEPADEGEEFAKQLRKPLYITEPFCFLSVNGDAVEIRQNKIVRETIPFRRISEIMVMEKSSFSTALLRQCDRFNIPLTVTLHSGYFVTDIAPHSRSSFDTLALHSRKFESLTDSDILSVAQEIAAAKVKNYFPLFQQRYVSGTNGFLQALEKITEKIPRAATIDVVRGLEGTAARMVYKEMNKLIEVPAFQFRARIRDNPDRTNSLLNFSYYLLFARLNVTIRAAGLHPYLGFLHSAENSYESLVSDMVELFRSRMDRFVLRLIHLKVITEGDFVQLGTAYYLTHEGIRKFLLQYETEMEKKKSPEQLSLKEAMYVQVQNIRKWVLEGTSLNFYGWQL